MSTLQGRRGIITGASSGIGLATAAVLASEGAEVIVISRTGAPKNSTAGKTPAGVDNIHHFKGDITDYSAMKTIVEDLAESGPLDFLINNAGVSVKKRAEEITVDEFEYVQKINVFAAFNLSVLCYPYLKQSVHMGRIITISSMAAHLGFSLVVPYCVSKAAVLGLTRGLAVEWANDNLTVNSVAPGWFPSELTRTVMDDKRKAKILDRMPVHRFGESDNIGAMIAFLLSDSAKYITGQDFAVDGGALAYGF
jgi:NAD(P)-dependent dehydrogenase (short-subunit alcohol dehydrogenase family)